MMKKLSTGESDIVKFNVGGKIFSTFVSTLTKKIKKNNSDEYCEPHLLSSNFILISFFPFRYFLK
jgi:hypothetical protein